MKVHEFTVIASGLRPETDDIANRFFEAGCDDASISFQKGVLILEFSRDAPTFSKALLSAVGDTIKAGAKVERIEPDHLVSLTDIAKRTGLTKAAVSLYSRGERQAEFPAPVARVTTESPLWDWHEVATWMWEHERIDQAAVVQAKVVKEANLALAACDVPNDGFVRRLNDRLERCA